MARIVGVDPGQTRIGLAISDESQSIAFPRETVAAGRTVDDSAARVAVALAGERLAHIVVGLPLRLDGTEGEAARKARLLGEALRAAVDVDVVYCDERMTTLAAERSLREMGRKGTRRREVVDQSAATILLQGYLDSKGGGSWTEPDG